MLIGTTKAVVVYDYHLAKELLSKETAIGRPDIPVYNIRMLEGRHGILFNDNKAYRPNRRFIHKSLRDFGFGKKSMESIFMEEAEKVVEYFRAREGKPMHTGTVFNFAILNILWTMLASKRYDYDDERLHKLLRLLQGTNSTDLQKIVAFPYLRHIMPIWKEQKKVVQETYDLAKDMMNEHKETYDDEHMRDVIDVYLKEINEKNDDIFHEEQLLFNVTDLFFAGAETTSTTLEWAMLFLILNPSMQDKIHDEIYRELGNAKPTMDDAKRMVYTQAFIQETQRLGCITPVSVPHRATADIEVKGGYVIPKDTIIYPSLKHIMSDPDYWHNSDVFDPERFISRGSDGSMTLEKDERFVPFGIGKRVCLGETLAKTELFMLLTTLLQQFRFSASPDHPKPEVERCPGSIISAPLPFHVVAHSK